jgi:hypothetical protein
LNGVVGFKGGSPGIISIEVSDGDTKVFGISYIPTLTPLPSTSLSSFGLLSF